MRLRVLCLPSLRKRKKRVVFLRKEWRERHFFGIDVLRDDEKNALLALMHKLAQGEARIVECSGRDPEKEGNSPD